MVRRLVLTAACIDVGYIALFYVAGSWPLALVDVGEHCVVSGGLRAHPAPKMPGGWCIWLEECSHGPGFAADWLGKRLSLLPVAVVPAIVVANAGRYAVPLVVALLAYYLGLWALCNHLGPLEPLAGKGQQIVNWIHICIAFAPVGSAGGPLPAHRRDCRTQATQDGDAGRPDRPVQPAAISRARPSTRWQRASVPRSPWPCCCAISTTSNR